MSYIGNGAGRHGQRLTQAGVALFLIGLITGFFIHGMPLPKLALTAHLNAIIGGAFMVALGPTWPRLKLGPVGSSIALGLAIYGLYAGWLIYLLASAWGAGGMFPMSAGQSRGTLFEEAFVTTSFATVAATLIGFCLLLLWGLRGHPLGEEAADTGSQHDARRNP
jgi:(hydroxyamino)benzene mutase